MLAQHQVNGSIPLVDHHKAVLGHLWHPPLSVHPGSPGSQVVSPFTQQMCTDYYQYKTSFNFVTLFVL